MKLVRYGNVDRKKPGIIDAAGRIRDLSKIIPDIVGETLSPKWLAKLSKLDVKSLPIVRRSPRLGPCIGNVGNFIAIGLNYADHAAEAAMALPSEPLVFNKAPSSICGPNDNTLTPKDSTKLDYEVGSNLPSSSAAAPAIWLRTRRWRRWRVSRQRRLGTRFSDRTRRPVLQGQALRDFRAAGSLACYQGRDQGPPAPEHLAYGCWPRIKFDTLDIELAV